jgi:DNA-binding beta-propeller fold protein YncE
MGGLRVSRNNVTHAVGKTGLWLVMAMTAVAGVILLSGSQLSRTTAAARPATSGGPRLVSIQPLPETDGPMCEWTPASLQGGSLYAALMQRQQERAAATASAGTKDYADLKPIRWIHDPYAAFSSIAVDTANNEVVMTDENLFNIMVYDRMTSTPPTATMSEPKRKIGGLKTKIEFQCGLYIDPQSGDIYAVNNDTVDSLVIFSRKAQGDIPPDREIHTPHGTFGIAVDEAKQELYLTEQHDSAVVVYHKNAAREDSPVRLLQGDHTGLADPHGIALDTKNQWMFITNHGAVHKQDYTKKDEPASGGGRGGPAKENWPLDRSNAIPGSGKNTPPSITVHPMNAAGDTPALRTISGPKTRLDWPTGLAVDSERGELYVANDMDNSILVFNVTDNGDVAPKRMIRGPKTGLGNPTGIWLDSKNDELWAANFMNHSATVYTRSASGDVAPKRTIRSGPVDQPALGIGNPHPVAYDTKREQILVPN